MVASKFFEIKEEFVEIVIEEPLENINHPVYINILVSEMKKNGILKGFENYYNKVEEFPKKINEIIDSLMSGEMSELHDMTGVKIFLASGSISDPISTLYEGQKMFIITQIINFFINIHKKWLIHHSPYTLRTNM